MCHRDILQTIAVAASEGVREVLASKNRESDVGTGMTTLMLEAD